MIKVNSNVAWLDANSLAAISAKESLLDGIVRQLFGVGEAKALLEAMKCALDIGAFSLIFEMVFGVSNFDVLLVSDMPYS